MVYLAINGVTMPTDGSGEYDPLEVGVRQRALDGSYLNDTRAYKRPWKFRTKPMTELQAEALQALIQGRGFYFPYDSDGYATNGLGGTVGTGITYRQAAGLDAALAYDENGVAEAKYGAGSLCAAPAAATVNKVTTAIAQCSSIAGITLTNGAVVATDATKYWEGTGSILVTGDGVTANPTARFVTALAGIAAHKYTASAYLRGSGSAYLNFFDNAGATVDVHSATIALNSTWQRASASFTSVGAPPSLYLEIIGLLGTVSCYVDGVQIEDNTLTTNGNGAFATSWALPSASRVNGNIKYSAAPIGLAGMTVSMWVTKPPTYSDIQYLWYALDTAATGNTNSSLRVPSATPTSLTWQTTGSSGNESLTVTGLSYTGWHLITCVLRYDPETGEHLKSIYQDGVLKGSSDPASGSYPTSSQLGQFTIADTYFNPSTQCFFGRIDDAQVLPYPLDAASILGMYNAGVANGLTPRTVATGDFISEPSVTVQGRVEKVSSMPYRDSAGTYRANGKVIDFILEEV